MSGALADLRVFRRGAGRALLFVHGSAADYTTWMAQLAVPPPGLALIAYDRRGSLSAPFPPGLVPSTRIHVEDAARLIRRESGGQPALVCGSSYGAIIGLELARTAPELVAGLILCEPPLPAWDWLPISPAGFGCAFDRIAAAAGGPAAGEMFLRGVLGDPAFEAIHPQVRAALCQMWRQIRADIAAMSGTRVPYDELEAVRQPCLLLRGERSPVYYADALEVLARALPVARLATIPGAGHGMHIDNHREFRRIVVEFAREVASPA